MKIKASFETETYVSEGGYYVIKQENSEQDQQTVLLTPPQLRLIMKDMRKALSDTDWFSQVED